jgi:hypothetical protein
MQPANDDQITAEQSQLVALHARYLLALGNHRRVSFISGFITGVVSVFCAAYLFSSFA